MSSPTLPQTIAVIGTGTIGASWATLFLGAGLSVRASDPGAGAEAKLREFIRAAWPSMEALGQTSGRSAEDALAALAFFATPEEAATGADLVQENAPERIEIKRETYAKLEAALAPDVVIASSTSGIMPSELQAEMTNPGAAGRSVTRVQPAAPCAAGRSGAGQADLGGGGRGRDGLLQVGRQGAD